MPSEEKQPEKEPPVKAYPIVRPLDLKAITLGRGSHRPTDQPGNGDLCLLEAAAYMAGEPWTDHPKCVSPVLGIYGRRLNDLLSETRRQQLRQYIPAMLGTAGDGLDEARSYLALDWLIRTYTPTWLDLAGLTAEATALRDLRQIADMAAATEAGPVVRDARARAASVAAARAASVAASVAAAREAARATARVTAGVAAAVAAAWVAARATAEAAAGDAVDAARAAARSAARSAAQDKLGATMGTLQQSAVELFVAMLRPEVTS